MSTPFTATVDLATESQIDFVAKLLAERDWNNAETSGPKYIARTAVLNVVIGWAQNLMAEDTPAEIARLVHTANGGRYPHKGMAVNVILEHCGAQAGEGFEYAYAPLSKAGASKLIELLLALPKRVVVTAASERGLQEMPKGPGQAELAEVTEGVYVMAGATVKVQRAVHGSGHLYAKSMDPDTGKFVFVPRLVNDLADQLRCGRAHKMTLAEAAEYGALYGRCVECGRTLTDEDSIERGVGPICMTKFS